MVEGEGQKIAERLGQGVVCRGAWFPHGPEGEFLGYFFEDAAVTETSFLAKTFEEAKANLIEVRTKFRARPPVFGKRRRTSRERQSPGPPAKARRAGRHWPNRYI